MQRETIVEHTNVKCHAHCIMQEEDILEHTNAKCHLVHFSQLVDHCVT